MRITPEQYFSFRNEGYSDEDLAEELAKREGINIDELYRQGKTPGEIARGYSGINETDYENTIHPVENRGVFGTVLSGLARGTGDVAHMAGNILKTLDPEGGFNIGDAAGQAILDMEDYAKSKLDIMRPDRDEVEGNDSFLKRGVKGFLRAVPAAVGVMGTAAVGSAIAAPVLAAAATVAPVLGAPAIATGLNSLIAGSLGGTAYGLNTYADALEEYKVQNPNATEAEAYNYAKTRGLKEGGAEFVSNAITMGLFKFGRISNIAPAETIKQILKTPPKQLLKLWGLETGQELLTEEYQSISEVQDKQAAGIPTPSVKEAAIETVLPTVLLSSMFWLGGTAMEAKTKYNTLKELNSPEKEVRVKAADSITKILTDEKEPVIAKAWKTMTDIKIDRGDHIDVNANILNFDPNAKVADTEATAATEQPAAGGVSQITENTADATTTEEQVTPGIMQKGDLRPYNKNRPYTSEIFATKALENISPKKLDRENYDYPIVPVEGGFVIRPTLKKAATETIVEKLPTAADTTGTTGTTTVLTEQPTVKKVVQKQVPLSAEQIAEATNITVDEYNKLKPELQAMASREAAVVLGTNKRTVSVEEDVPVDAPAGELKSLAETSAASGGQMKIVSPKITTVPSVRMNETTREWTPANLTGDVLHEQKPLRHVQKLALGQIREATLPDNDFKPWPVGTTTDAKGQRDAAGFNWINKKAIAALPVEEQPKGPVTIQTLKALESRGFIKKAIYTGGITRWVPAEWKAPVAKESKLVKPAKAPVPAPPSTQLPTPDNTKVRVKSKLDADIDVASAQLKQAKEIGAQPEVIEALKKTYGKLTMKKIKLMAKADKTAETEEIVSIEAQEPVALSSTLESSKQALNEPKTSLKETNKGLKDKKKLSDTEQADAEALKVKRNLSRKQKVRKRVEKDLDAFFGKSMRSVSEVVDSYEDLPESTRKSHEDMSDEDPLFSKSARKDMLGLHDPTTNKMYFLADNISSARDKSGSASAVGVHEAVHYMLRNSPEFKQVYDNLLVRMNSKKVADPKVQEAIDFAKANTPDAANHTEEGLAYYLQDSHNANRPFYKEIISKLRIWFDKHFVGLNLTGHEMGMIVAKALRVQSAKVQVAKKITVSRVKSGKNVSETVSAEEATQEVKDNQTTIQRLTDMLDCL